MVYPPSTGPELSAPQALTLDDTYLASDPFAYFRARIDMLLLWSERASTTPRQSGHAASDAESRLGSSPQKASDEPDSELRTRFAAYTKPWLDDAPFSRMAIDTQFATDAYPLRHHAAESLVRLAAALLTPTPVDTPSSLWATLANGPVSNADIIAFLRASLSSETARDTFARLVMSPQVVRPLICDARAASVIDVFADWLEYTTTLLSTGHLDLNAVHNKVKHGLAVGAHGDLRLTFATTPLTRMETFPRVPLLGRGPSTSLIDPSWSSLGGHPS